MLWPGHSGGTSIAGARSGRRLSSDMVASRNRSRRLRIGMIICSEYEANPRARRQAEALASRGDDVTVVALHADGRPREEMIDSVRVVHTPIRKYRGDSATSYVSLYGGFFARASAWFFVDPGLSTSFRRTPCLRRSYSRRRCSG